MCFQHQNQLSFNWKRQYGIRPLCWRWQARICFLFVSKELEKEFLLCSKKSWWAFFLQCRQCSHNMQSRNQGTLAATAWTKEIRMSQSIKFVWFFLNHTRNGTTTRSKLNRVFAQDQLPITSVLVVGICWGHSEQPCAANQAHVTEDIAWRWWPCCLLRVACAWFPPCPSCAWCFEASADGHAHYAQLYVSCLSLYVWHPPCLGSPPRCSLVSHIKSLYACWVWGWGRICLFWWKAITMTSEALKNQFPKAWCMETVRLADVLVSWM